MFHEMLYLPISYQILKQMIALHSGGGMWSEKVVFKLDP